ncbi:MAG TPA: hydrogenase maturation protease [Candidatus Angelobacter sp.]|nr:hydrogenase maturation protease [Candidatus Angelobacter sp.]
MPRVLIIGYGNCLRADDAVGAEAADRLAEFYGDDPHVRVISAHQLTPDVIYDVADADFLLLLDAAASGVPGIIKRTTVAAHDSQSAFTHGWTPATVLLASRSLYGRAPTAVSLTLAAESFELGTDLSPTIRDRVTDFLAAAKQVVSEWLAASLDAAEPGTVSCKK